MIGPSPDDDLTLTVSKKVDFTPPHRHPSNRPLISWVITLPEISWRRSISNLWIFLLLTGAHMHWASLFSQTYFSTSIEMGDAPRATFTELRITMSGVPMKYLDRLETKMRRTLRLIIRRGIDMKRLHSIIDGCQRMVGNLYFMSILF